MYTYPNHSPYDQQTVWITTSGFDIRVFFVVEDHVLLKISKCLYTEKRIMKSSFSEIYWAKLYLHRLKFSVEWMLWSS